MEHRALPGGPLVQAAAQQGQIFLPGGETRRHRMSAKPLQQISTSADALMQVKALDTASAALALALFVHRNTITGRPVALHQTGGHDADDAGVPVPAPKQDHTIFHAAGVLVQLLQSSFQDLLFRLLPGGVDLPQLGGPALQPGPHPHTAPAAKR